MSVSAILVPAECTFSANDIYFKLQSSYSEGSFPENYNILVKVLMRPTPGHADPYDELVELRLRPDADGIVDFNLSSIIDNAIRVQLNKGEPPIPEVSQLQNPYVSQITFDYAVNIAELEGNPPEEGSFTNIFEGYAVLGGIDRTKWNKDYLMDIDPQGYSAFFSWYVNNRRVGRNQLQWLNYFNNGPTASISCEMKIYNSALVLVQTETFSATVPQYSPVSFPGIFAVNTGGADVVMYTMEINGGPVIRYVVDNKIYDNNRDIIYLNGYNTPQGLRCTGHFVRDVEMERQKSVAIDNVNGVSSTKKEKMQIGVDWENVYTFRTGYITKKEREALDEMLILNFAWEYKGGKYHSLDFIQDSYTVVDTYAMLDSLSFQATDAVKKKIIPQETTI